MRPTLAILLVVLPACATRNMPAPQPDATIACTSAANCDDHTACTIDSCDVSGVCVHTAIDAMCPMGQHCVSGTGCTSVMSCASTADCDDHIACTVDSCGPSRTCAHVTVDSLCMAPTPVCNVTMGCIAGSSTRCTTMADCDDHVACTVDACGVNMMCTHTAVDSSCPMGQRCTPTGCAMVHACTMVSDCMNASFWNFCDGDPTCSPEFGCRFPTPRACNDSNPCTVDSCSRTIGTNGACVFACDRSMASCAGTPACPVSGPTCVGHFALSPPPMGSCFPGLGGPEWDLSTVTITNISGALVIQPAHLSSPNGPLRTDPTTTSCPSFTATRRIDGACIENYTLTGTFTDDNHFSGTFTTSFMPDPLQMMPAACDNPFTSAPCTGGPYSFSAMRIP